MGKTFRRNYSLIINEWSKKIFKFFLYPDRKSIDLQLNFTDKVDNEAKG